MTFKYYIVHFFWHIIHFYGFAFFGNLSNTRFDIIINYVEWSKLEKCPIFFGWKFWKSLIQTLSYIHLLFKCCQSEKDGIAFNCLPQGHSENKRELIWKPKLSVKAYSQLTFNNEVTGFLCWVLMQKCPFLITLQSSWFQKDEIRPFRAE